MADQIKVIFLDFDGPMIPARAYFLPENRTGLVARFDPCAVGMLNELIERSDAYLVISSSWATMGKQPMKMALQVNGVRARICDLDEGAWTTPRKFSSSRPAEIGWWLEEYGDRVSHWVAIDDQWMSPEDVPNLVHVTMDDGLQMTHLVQAAKLLDMKLKRFL